MFELYYFHGGLRFFNGFGILGVSCWGVSGDKAAVLAVFWYGGGVGLIVSYFWRSGFDFLNWVFLIICRRMWGKLFNFF